MPADLVKLRENKSRSLTKLMLISLAFAIPLLTVAKRIRPEVPITF